MRLNVGSGPHPFEGWLNVDIDQGAHTNVRADVFHMPFDDNSFESVYLGHVLEHIAWRKMRYALGEIARVCRRGAEVMVVGPDMDRAVLRAMRREEPVWLLGDIRGSQPLGNHDGGGGHAWMPTEFFTCVALEDSGFRNLEPFDIALLPDGYPCVSKAPWQFAIRAITP